MCHAGQVPGPGVPILCHLGASPLIECLGLLVGQRENFKGPILFWLRGRGPGGQGCVPGAAV